MSGIISFGTPTTPAGLITTDARVKLWNTQTWEYQSGTMGSGVGGLVSVDNFPAVISGANVPVSGTFYQATQAISNVNDDPVSKYKITDIDPTEGNQYFGYVDKDGAWYIMNLTTTAARYVKGDSGYLAAWAGKGGLGYDYFYTIF